MCELGLQKGVQIKTDYPGMYTRLTAHTGLVRRQQMEKGFNTICMMVGVFLLTMLLVLGWSAPTRKALFDYGAKSVLSEADAEAITDPETANKKAYEKFSREAW